MSIKTGKPFNKRGLPNIHKKPLALSVASAVVASVVSTSSTAAIVLEEVVVSATKRQEMIMDVPLAISSVSGDFAREANLNDIKDMVKLSPGISGNSQDSFLDAITVRGIRTNDFGNGGDPSIGVYKNGNYQGRNGSAVTSLFDIESVEVLRGPQGFLYGRNAISGAINAHTVKASTEGYSGYFEADVAERGVGVFEGAFNFPINENLAGRVSAYHSEEDGWLEHTPTGRDYLAHEKDALRFSMHYTTDTIEADMVLEYEDRDQDGTVYRATGSGEGWDNLTAAALANGNFAPPVATGSDKSKFNADLGPDQDIYDEGEVFSFGLQVEVDLDGLIFTSITGYRDHNYGYAEDFDGTSVELFYYSQDQEGDYFEQEFRLASDTEDDLSWYAGVSYYQEDIDSTFLGQQAEEVYCGIYFAADCAYVGAYYGFTFVASPDGLINDRNRTIGDFEGYAAYVDVTYAFSDQFSLSTGVRLTTDNKDFSQQTLPGNPSAFAGGVQAPQTGGVKLTDDESWTNLTWRVLGTYYLNEDTMLFSSVSTGSKSGGYDSFRLDAQGQPNSFDEESVVSFELGYKGVVWEGRSHITANLFYYEYEDLQIVFAEPGSPLARVGNIGEVTGKGFEATSTTGLTEIFTLMLGISYLDTEVDGYEQICDPVGSNACNGESLSGVPEWTFFGSLNASYPVDGGEWVSNLIYTQEDDTESNVQSSLSISNDGVKDVQFNIGYIADAGWSIKAYVENLTDEDGYDALTGGSTTAGGSNYPDTGINSARPRTAGVRFGYEF